MRSPGAYGGFYASLSRYYDDKLRSEDYRFQQARAFAQSRASRFFRLCWDRWPDMGNSGKGIVNDVVCLIMNGTKLTSSGSSFTEAVKITAIWVEHAHRSKGHGRTVLSELAKMADQSGCVLIAVSNPIEYPEHFTAKDVLTDSEKGEWESSMKYVLYGSMPRRHEEIKAHPDGRAWRETLRRKVQVLCGSSKIFFWRTSVAPFPRPGREMTLVKPSAASGGEGK